MSIAPVHRWNLRIHMGATFRDYRIWKIGESKETAVGFDFTGCTARAKARPDARSKKVLFELTTENGGIVLGDTPGEIALYLSDEQTDLLTACGGGVWDLEVVLSNGDVRLLFAGSVSIFRGSTYD